MEFEGLAIKAINYNTACGADADTGARNDRESRLCSHDAAPYGPEPNTNACPGANNMVRAGNTADRRSRWRIQSPGPASAQPSHPRRRARLKESQVCIS